MTQKEQLRVESLSEILDGLNIQLTQHQIEQIIKEFGYSLDMEREMESYSYLDATPIKCEKCANKDLRIKDLEGQVKVYNDSVKRRRNADRVWISNGEVRYE